MVTSSVPPSLPAVFGRYSLIRRIGEGGMGAVYEAVHVELGKKVAIKVLRAKLAHSADVRERFSREGRAASRIRHPNVVDVYDVGVDGDRPYLVMELLDGEDLASLLRREKRLTAERTAELLVPAVAGVAAAHDLGVVHRDLKPENVFLCSDRGGLKPKVVDFGISKVTDPERAQGITGTGAFLGTPHYMSPEQAQGAKHIDWRTDQYSLGVVLYECVTGRRPIEDTALYALMQELVRGRFPRPRELNPELPPAFEDVILRALATSAEDRFATTRALGRALLPFAGPRVNAVYGDELASDEPPPVEAGSPPGVSEPSASGTSASASEPGTLGTATTLVHHRDISRPARARWPIFGATALLAVGGLFTLQALRLSGPGPAPASDPALSARASASEAVATAPSSASSAGVEGSKARPDAGALVSKHLVSRPAGALVRVDGVDVGTTPMPLHFPANEARRVELRLGGHVPEERRVSAADPSEIVIELRPRRPKARDLPAVPPSVPTLAPR